MTGHYLKPTRAQISRGAIQRLYIAMRHLFIRGGYKPLGVSGEAMIKSLLDLKPEIYGKIADPERMEIDGLLYIFARLPEGIEECKYIKLIAREGYHNSFEPIVAKKRRRDCYRIDETQMYIEMTRGRSDIYDVLTHLTFMFIEAEKIRNKALDTKDRETRDWTKLKELVQKIDNGEEFNKEIGFSYLSTLTGRTYADIEAANESFNHAIGEDSLFKIVYWLGYHSIEEHLHDNDREISFSIALRKNLGSHILGTSWAQKIKDYLFKNNMQDRPIHIISSNLHSVMNCLYAKAALKNNMNIDSLLDVAEELSIGSNKDLREQVKKKALKNGMYEIHDESGTNIGVQIFDLKKMDDLLLPKEINSSIAQKHNIEKVLIVMDYAFGEQAYELMDELLKPHDINTGKSKLNIQSVNIMGKAGILEGNKGDIMIPNAHVFEGTADNYPFNNLFDTSVFDQSGLDIYFGPMITVLGTSLSNKDILRYFNRSSWKAVGLEMEGAHYQKAIQAASKIRNSICEDVSTRYAYYASDNPLETGSTLSSGGLGKTGVAPTYLITISFINSIFK